MRRAFALSWLIGVALVATLAAADLPYLGEWSNGRGETLTITEDSLQFADDEPVKYRDLTRATDGNSFVLQITTAGEINAFPGKFLAVALEDGSLKMTTFASHADYLQEKNPQSVVTWFHEDEN